MEVIDEQAPFGRRECDQARRVFASPIERDEDDGYDIVEPGARVAVHQHTHNGHPIPTKVRVLDYRSIEHLLPFAWAAWKDALVSALNRQQLGLFDGVVITPRVEIVDGKPTRYQSTDVIYCKGAWHTAVHLDLGLLIATRPSLVGDMRELTEKMLHLLHRWENRQKGAR